MYHKYFESADCYLKSGFNSFIKQDLCMILETDF